MSESLNIQTAILRFRDLVTQQNQTINEHRTLIDKNGYVWWGWWHKLDETVPDSAFRELLAIRDKNGALTLFLIDSGQDLIYEVICDDIYWDREHKEIPSPEPDKTPEYYSKQKPCKAWFRFVKISDPINPDTLNGFSYLQVDELFSGGKSNYTPFYNKQVYSISELRQQDRTIWFVRQFQAGDLTHEVKLLDSSTVSPSHFSKRFYQTQSKNLLWLSDIHFSTEDHHAFPYESGAERFELGDMLIRQFQKKYGFIGGVIISGDITWKSLPEEFEIAKKFISKLDSWSRLSGEQIAICPGNHDLKFKESSGETAVSASETITAVNVAASDSLVAVEPSTTEALTAVESVKETAVVNTASSRDNSIRIDVAEHESRNAYNKFYQQLYYLEPNKFLSCGKRFLMNNSIPIEVVCLNSSLLQQHKGRFQGHGFIGRDQLADAEKEIEWSREDAQSENESNVFKIVVLHHHLMPTTFSYEAAADYAYSTVLDSEAVVRWIVKNRVNLVLHGHMHQPFAARLCRPIDVNNPDEDWHEFTVLGLGSSGVRGELGEIGKNTVGFLTFNNDEVEVSIYSIHPTNDANPIWSVKVPYKTN